MKEEKPGPRMVRVHWFDSHAISAWDADYPEAVRTVPLECRSVGEVLFEDDERLCLVMNVLPDGAGGAQHNLAMCIPKCAIIRRQELRPFVEYPGEAEPAREIRNPAEGIPEGADLPYTMPYLGIPRQSHDERPRDLTTRDVDAVVDQLFTMSGTSGRLADRMVQQTGSAIWDGWKRPEMMRRIVEILRKRGLVVRDEPYESEIRARQSLPGSEPGK